MSAGCPGRDVLHAFIERRLDAEWRRKVIEHVAICVDCRDVIMADAGEATAVHKNRWLSGLVALLAGVLLLGLVLSHPDLWRRWRSANEMDAVVAASNHLRHRPSLARLSGSFPYRDVRIRNRGADEPALRRYDASVLALLARLQQETEQSPSPSRVHALGVAHLLAGETGAAIRTLEQLVRTGTGGRRSMTAALRASNNAALLNDLAVAYETDVENGGDASLHALAFEAVDRAWKLEKTAPIAWTRAVIIEAHHLREPAIAAWREYLALESDSAWSDQAQRRLQQLLKPTDTELWPSIRERLSAAAANNGDVRQPVNRFRQEVRLWCEDELLPAWGEAVLRGDASAAERLATIDFLARALVDVGGEREVADAVAAIRQAPASALRQLAKGHVAFGAGRRNDRTILPGETLRHMNEAAVALTPELTPFAWRVKIERASALYLTNDYSGATAELRSLPLGDSSPLSNAAKGKIHGLLGIIALQGGSYAESARHYEQGVTAFRNAGERDYEATLLSRLVAPLELAGDHQRARSYRAEALALLERTGDPKHRHDAMMEAAYVAIGNDHQALADLFLDTLVANNRAARNHVTTCTSLMWRSAYRYRRQLPDAANDVDEAQRVCSSIADRDVRERAMANLEIAKAAVGTAAAASPTIRGLSDSIAYYEKTKSRVWLRTAFLARARLSETAAPGDAERDYRAALEVAEGSREKIDQRQLRISFTATADEIADAYIEFLLRQKRPEEALEVADRNRVRELVDGKSGHWQTDERDPLLPQIQAGLPAGAVLIEFRVLSGTIAAWVVSERGATAHLLPVSVAQLTEALDPIAAEPDDAVLNASGSFLYDALLRPLEARWQAASTLVLVPDSELELVPFSALHDRVRRQYVMETRATVLAPSARLFVQSLERARDRSRGEERAVIIEARSGGKGFATLPAATAEARSLASLYPGARLITGLASSQAILDEARNASILQLIGHTSSDRDGSRALRLGEDTPALHMEEILATPMPRLWLVYLSACATDSGPLLKSEGSITIARTFFAAGVPVVVGTLWPIDDTAARVAAQTFHEHLRRGHTPAEALRQAQLAVWSRGGRSRADWAAFRIVGGGL